MTTARQTLDFVPTAQLQQLLVAPKMGWKILCMWCPCAYKVASTGESGNKKGIFFIDDLSMPFVDTYDTQSAVMLLTQIMLYSQVYDREALEEKKGLVYIFTHSPHES